MRAAIALTLVLLAAPSPALGAYPLPDDDAGSGTDAPDAPPDALPIAPGIPYRGTISSTFDLGDVYSFAAGQGDAVFFRIAGTLGCADLLDDAGTTLASACTSGTLDEVLFAVLPRDGTWRISYHTGVTQHYRFSLGVNAPAPHVSPVALDLAPAGGTRSSPTPATQDGPHAVIAVVDMGVNPYHAAFAAPALVDPPSTWLPGYPADATRLDLALDAPTYDAALAQDRARLMALPRSTYDPVRDAFNAHLAYVPGTRIVGAISFGEWGSRTDPPGVVPVLDEKGHGTGSAGLALGSDRRHADGNVLVVVVEVSPGPELGAGIRWAARQPWIDAISVSLGTRGGVAVTGNALGLRTGPEWGTLEAAANGKPVFVASGNGLTGTGTAPDHCLNYGSDFSGPSWVTRVGAADPTNGDPAWWHCLPVDVLGATNVLAPSSTSKTDIGAFSGTSAATPNVASHAMHVLLAARREGLDLGPRLAAQHLLNASAPPPGEPGLWRDVVLGPLAPAQRGFGLADAAAADRALGRALAGEPPAPRPELDAWFARDRAVRNLLWGPGSVNGVSLL